jgi:hypothetical protein
MLCQLLNVPKEEILQDFLNTLAQETYGKTGEPQDSIARYFIQCGYGQDNYTKEEIEKMLSELRCISSLWPDEAPTEIITRHASWRGMYHAYWFEKWEELRGRIIESSKVD